MRAIYLDYAATAPVDPAVAETMKLYLDPTGDFGNPASTTHAYGQRARAAVELAREQVASLIGAEPDEIIWTSGATEAINLALKSVLVSSRGPTPHIVTSTIEHKATLDTCGFLQEGGVAVTYVPPDRTGTIAPSAVLEALRPETRLVSLMLVNNETGTITDIESVAEAVSERGILVHVDAAQGLGRLRVSTRTTPIDFMSVSGHKICGPKGIGALFAARKSAPELRPLIHGGGHERGIRSGTLATHQIAGFGMAAALVEEKLEDDRHGAALTAEVLISGIGSAGDVQVNARESLKVPGILSLLVRGVESESLLAMSEEVAFSNGSACTSEDIEPSHVLLGIGLTEEDASQTIRLSVGRFTTQEEARRAGSYLAALIQELRNIATL